MHHWSIRTYTSFMNKVGEQLRDHLVQEALRYGYLLAAVLAVTSLHMATEASCQATIDQNVDEALHYQTQAVAGLRSTLGNLSPENCDAVFITSLIVMVCTIVSPLLQSKSQHTQSTAEAMIGMSDLLKGIGFVLDVSRPWFKDSPVRCIFDAGHNLTIMPIAIPSRKRGAGCMHRRWMSDTGRLQMRLSISSSLLLGPQTWFPGLYACSRNFLPR
jgi:hypothetical protein